MGTILLQLNGPIPSSNLVRWMMKSRLLDQQQSWHLLTFSDTYIQKAKKTYQDSRSRRNYQTLNTELHDVQRIMVQNIDDVLKRGAVLSGLCCTVGNISHFWCITKSFLQNWMTSHRTWSIMPRNTRRAQPVWTQLLGWPLVLVQAFCFSSFSSGISFCFRRSIFPAYKVNVFGLKRDKYYSAILCMEQVSSNQCKWDGEKNHWV